MGFPILFQNSYNQLPDRFFTRTRPTPVKAPRLIRVNVELAAQLGIDPEWLASEEGVQVLSGNVVPENTEPIAMAYAGHQFGNWVPQLGDGRAILLGEVVGQDGIRRDIHLKGAGPTPFSRRGDGRAALGPVLREYVVSEAMARLGIPTTRALAAVTTGEEVMREEMLPGAVFARVASSHIRVGTFQFFATRGDEESVRLLADHVISRHYPEARNEPNPYLALLERVISAQAQLIAKWLLVGFIHGVMNTDNMAVSGETIDYGPCAFMDEYHPGTVYSYIDQNGRYAYGAQPSIALWNLTRLAECLLPLFAEDPDAAVRLAQEQLGKFEPQFTDAYEAGLRRKIGLTSEQLGDADLCKELLKLMADHGADFTLTFRELPGALNASPDGEGVRRLFVEPAAFDQWAEKWKARLAADPLEPEQRTRMMNAVNPLFIPRNHQVEAVIRAAVDQQDYAPFERLLEVLSRPFDEQPGAERYALAPEEHERVHQTFCGT